MKFLKSKLKYLFLLTFSLAVINYSYAHHSYAMFDMETDLVFSGIVVEYLWRSPHAHIVINVESGEGIDTRTIGTWDIEGASPAIMTRQGWNRISYQPGDNIRLVARPMRDGSKGAALFYAIKEDGSCLFMDIARPEDSMLCEG